jgi:hypothetical protein
MTVAERRYRLARRHHLAPGARAVDPVQAARALVGLHATDPASMMLAALVRLRAPAVSAVEDALYRDRSLLRMLAMRRTMFAVPTDLAPTVHAAATTAIAARERGRLVKLVAASGVAADPAAWLADVEESVVRQLRANGGGTAAELSAAEPRMRTRVQVPGPGGAPAEVAVGSRVLFVLSAEGRIARGRPRGSWVSMLVQWHPIEVWLGGPLPRLAVDAARVELVRRWLAAFGPGTVADLKWWTGWTLGEVRRALGALDPVEVELEDGGTGLVLPGDVEPEPPVEPWAALLPALDPTVMGWAARGWYLGGHAGALFDRNGNAGPTVWWDGRVVGGWAHRRDGEVALRLLEDVGAAGQAAVREAAARLVGPLGGVRVTPRFRTPLERELSE